nr:helix-turn-helix domain-containing protein [Wenzhouxiangella sp. XN24]
MATFGDVLKKEREVAGLTFRALGKATGLNHGYLSKLESGGVQPRKKNVILISDALAKCSGQEGYAKEAVRERLLAAAGLSKMRQSVEQEIRDRFASLLENEGLQDHQIKEALEKVTTVSMQRVLAGDDQLHIRSLSASSDMNIISDLGQEVVVLSESEHCVRAGRRGEIRVRGEITPDQRDQLETIAKLIGQVLAMD